MDLPRSTGIPQPETRRRRRRPCLYRAAAGRRSTFKGVPLFLYHGLPPALSHWGAAGALRYLLPDTNVKVAPMDDPAAASQFQSLRLATLVWVQPRRHLWIAVRTPETLDRSE